jgi:hypothetical protein
VKTALDPDFSANDGTFWISWDDFGQLFDMVTICKRGVPIIFDKEAE